MAGDQKRTHTFSRVLLVVVMLVETQGEQNDFGQQILHDSWLRGGRGPGTIVAILFEHDDDGGICFPCLLLRMLCFAPVDPQAIVHNKPRSAAVPRHPRESGDPEQASMIPERL